MSRRRVVAGLFGGAATLLAVSCQPQLPFRSMPAPAPEPVVPAPPVAAPPAPAPASVPAAPAVPTAAAAATPLAASRPGEIPAEARRQWAADWDDPRFSAARAHFRGDSRPKGTARERYDVLCPFYYAHGIARPLKYVSEEIVTARFYGLQTRAHRDLAAALTKAEGILRAKGHMTAPIKEGWAFNARTTSERRWSNHADGRAIDFDAPTNPHLTGEFERAIVTALTGIDVGLEHPTAADGGDPYDALKAASDRFRTNYTKQGLTRRIAELKTQEASRAGREARLAAEQRQLLEEELGYVEGELPSAVGLAKTIAALRDRSSEQRRSVDLLTRQVEQSTVVVERAELQRALEVALRDLGETRRQLRTAERQRDAHYLRGYARTGFLSLPEDFVDAMKQAGLEWGGDWEGAKDFMHFELPGCGGHAGGC